MCFLYKTLRFYQTHSKKPAKALRRSYLFSISFSIWILWQKKYNNIEIHINTASWKRWQNVSILYFFCRLFPVAAIHFTANCSFHFSLCQMNHDRYFITSSARSTFIIKLLFLCAHYINTLHAPDFFLYFEPMCKYIIFRISNHLCLYFFFKLRLEYANSIWKKLKFEEEKKTFFTVGVLCLRATPVPKFV